MGSVLRTPVLNMVYNWYVFWVQVRKPLDCYREENPKSMFCWDARRTYKGGNSEGLQCGAIGAM